MMADGEQIHSAMYPGSIFGDLFSEQTQVSIRQHALESACFVVCATAWLDADQQAQTVFRVTSLRKITTTSSPLRTAKLESGRGSVD